ncbi:hypothetical protein WISP_37405 [Willisornis vidua]|uniref:Uncharacterized protein n=1 Tax=Willisornis vidua TaxID=1566151 RepID=A0ABQ9DMK7_9PASS|nr:hypothetical protein WISP_37405 [Willisornis vidua]
MLQADSPTAHVNTIVKQSVEVHSREYTHLRKPEQVDARRRSWGKTLLDQPPGRTCDPQKGPTLEPSVKECILCKGSTWEQFMKNCSPRKGLMLEKFVKDCLSWERPLTGAGEECEES